MRQLCLGSGLSAEKVNAVDYQDITVFAILLLEGGDFIPPQGGDKFIDEFLRRHQTNPSFRPLLQHVISNSSGQVALPQPHIGVKE